MNCTVDDEPLVVCTLIRPAISSSRYCSSVAVSPAICRGSTGGDVVVVGGGDVGADRSVAQGAPSTPIDGARRRPTGRDATARGSGHVAAPPGAGGTHGPCRGCRTPPSSTTAHCGSWTCRGTPSGSAGTPSAGAAHRGRGRGDGQREPGDDAVDAGPRRRPRPRRRGAPPPRTVSSPATRRTAEVPGGDAVHSASRTATSRARSAASTAPTRSEPSPPARPPARRACARRRHRSPGWSCCRTAAAARAPPPTPGGRASSAPAAPARRVDRVLHASPT